MANNGQGDPNVGSHTPPPPHNPDSAPTKALAKDCACSAEEPSECKEKCTRPMSCKWENNYSGMNYVCYNNPKNTKLTRIPLKGLSGANCPSHFCRTKCRRTCELCGADKHLCIDKSNVCQPLFQGSAKHTTQAVGDTDRGPLDWQTAKDVTRNEADGRCQCPAGTMQWNEPNTQALDHSHCLSASSIKSQDVTKGDCPECALNASSVQNGIQVSCQRHETKLELDKKKVQVTDLNGEMSVRVLESLNCTKAATTLPQNVTVFEVVPNQDKRTKRWCVPYHSPPSRSCC